MRRGRAALLLAARVVMAACGQDAPAGTDDAGDLSGPVARRWSRRWSRGPGRDGNVTFGCPRAPFDETPERRPRARRTCRRVSEPTPATECRRLTNLSNPPDRGQIRRATTRGKISWGRGSDRLMISFSLLPYRRRSARRGGRPRRGRWVLVHVAASRRWLGTCRRPSARARSTTAWPSRRWGCRAVSRCRVMHSSTKERATRYRVATRPS